MTKSAREPFNVLVPPPVQRQIEALAGKRIGYQNVRKLLGIDPCHADLKAYRLSGPLAPVVCGLHLKRGYRLAFTTQPPLAPNEDPRTQIVVLYLGKRSPGTARRPTSGMSCTTSSPSRTRLPDMTSLPAARVIFPRSIRMSSAPSEGASPRPAGSMTRAAR